MRTRILVVAVAALAGCGDNLPAVIDAAVVPPIDAPPPSPADAVAATCAPISGGALGTEIYLPAGTFTRPILLTAPAGDRRQFVVEQAGLIRIIDQGAVLPRAFLDLRSDAGGPVHDVGVEEGLLGLAFHPDFATNRRFYVYYTAVPAGDNVLAEYQVDSTGLADPDSARILFSIPDGRNHNGGMIEFSPADGLLYIGIGDGGGGGGGNDPSNRAQRTTVLFGKILRIDVDARTGDKPYGIPPSNPFADSPDGPEDPRPEVWAYGLRNPYRFGFDDNGDLFIGDVGQDAYEEVDIQRVGTAGGQNFGWDDVEGIQCSAPEPDCSLTDGGKVAPATTRPNDPWSAVIGGSVYRGDCFPDLVGDYFYADYRLGEVWSFDAATATGDTQRIAAIDGLVTSLHPDALGELYITLLDGSILHVVAN